VGRLNFWAARANLCVQVLDLRPSLSAVLRRFEQVRQALEPEGLFAPERKQPLPQLPAAIALLTSVPSSALADMLRTAAERWPATRIHVVPIPVQGAVGEQICQALTSVILQAEGLGLEAVVLARGGGSREDLAVFDGEELARLIAACPLPVVTGLGHEDDTTIADLVADYRAATPTAAIVALLPERSAIGQALGQIRAHLGQLVALRLQAERQRQRGRQELLDRCHPIRLLQERRRELGHRLELLGALSPQRLLERGFALVRGESGQLLRSVDQVHAGDSLQVELADGSIEAQVAAVRPSPRQS